MISLCQADYTVDQQQQQQQWRNMSTPPIWISGSTRKSRAWAVWSGDGSRGLPVWLVKVDVEGSSPVLEHSLLCDEAVVASLSTPLVGQIHGALVWPVELVVMIRHRGMGGGPARERERESRKAWWAERLKVQGRDVRSVIIKRWCEGEEAVSGEGRKCATTKKKRRIRTRACGCGHYILFNASYIYRCSLSGAVTPIWIELLHEGLNIS